MAATINVESHDKLTAPATINPLKKNDYIKELTAVPPPLQAGIY